MILVDNLIHYFDNKDSKDIEDVFWMYDTGIIHFPFPEWKKYTFILSAFHDIIIQTNYRNEENVWMI